MGMSVTDAPPLFREVQRFRQWFFYIPVLVVTGVIILGRERVRRTESELRTTYNAYGNRGVQLVLTDGSRILVGSQKPEELLNALRAAGARID